ncbi:hypothetical protein C2S52_022648 [Perilla frutescens var. hirtella]|nr:hypothetical protein C2S52_022648 [Perilla frutescens var. hirtella]
MDSPFNRRWYQQPDPTRRPFHPSPSSRGVPVYRVDPTQETRRPVESASAPKVVRIPVQFVGSGQPDRARSAVKIQKVVRGFLVRKSLRKIEDIKLEVDEIEERLQRKEVVDSVKRDAKERLRVSESLMALLLKLDSISGVDFGVRVCRKAVIRKAIALQERIDAIVAAADSENSEIVDLESEPENDEHVPLVNFEAESGGDGDRKSLEDDEAGIVDVGVDCEVKVSGDVGAEGSGNENKTNRELLEKMMGENEKMLCMMNQLFERSETQTRMLNALTHRVELLEKAFVCDKLMRKKKMKKNNNKN